MPPSPAVGGRIRFDDFEVDARQATLRRDGAFISLQEKPLQVLLALLERPGQIVTREELRNRLWPGDAFGAFEDGLNTAVRKLRVALDDSADAPRFIETVPRRGYRFAAPVQSISPDAEDAPPETPSTHLASQPSPASAKRHSPFRIILAVAVAGVFLAGTSWLLVKQYSGSLSGDSPIASLAVLPLANLTGDPAQSYIVDGMTDELTTSLAQLNAMRVTSETSALQYRGTNKPLRQVANELGVDAIVEGSVTRSGNAVRVTAQLIDAKTDRHLWAQSYERDAGDILQLQSELARDIAAQVRARVSGPQGKNPAPATTNPAAYEAYSRGRSHVEKWTAEGAAEGLKYFQRAIEIDPNFALAYVGEAECYRFGIPGIPYKDSINLAMEASKRALDIQPDMGEAHAAVGYLLMLRDWKFAEAEAELRRGIALSPNYAPAHHWYAHLLMNLGRFDESLQESKKLLELDPVSPAANLHLGNQYLASREWDLAVEQEKKTLQMEPDYVEAHRQLAEAYLGKKMYAEAIAEMKRAADLSGPNKEYPLYPALLANIMGQAGRTEDARKLLVEIDKSKQPLLISYVYGGLGDKEKSIGQLNQALQSHSISLEMKFLPEFDPLRGDPRFNQLIHQVGII